MGHYLSLIVGAGDDYERERESLDEDSFSWVTDEDILKVAHALAHVIGSLDSDPESNCWIICALRDLVRNKKWCELIIPIVLEPARGAEVRDQIDPSLCGGFEDFIMLVSRIKGRAAAGITERHAEFLKKIEDCEILDCEWNFLLEEFSRNRLGFTSCACSSTQPNLKCNYDKTKKKFHDLLKEISALEDSASQISEVTGIQRLVQSASKLLNDIFNISNQRMGSDTLSFIAEELTERVRFIRAKAYEGR